VPAGQERLLRHRIRSVRSTQKITRAMELIAASRIVRAQQAIVAARPYAERIDEVVSELAATPEAKGHWMFARRGGSALVLVLGADRGLAGAFSSSLLRAAEELLGELSGTGPEPAAVAVGRKVVSYFRSQGRSLVGHFEGMADRPLFEDAQGIVGAIADQLASGTVGEVYLVSTRFVSTGTQKVEARHLLPIEQSERKGTTVFDFEPEPSQILDRLLPRWLEAEVYLALLESAASFNVSQQRAMKAATDNADKLVKVLRQAMNRARQDSITTEIMEIVGGAEALRQSDLGERTSSHPEIYVFPEAS